MNKAILSLLSAALFALAACSAGKPAEPPLAGARIGGPFTLVDQDGRTVRDGQFAGRYRIVYFGYTYCPDVCPDTLQKLMKAYQAFEKQAPDRAAKVQPIFISVDPERDTPAVLKQYVAAFDPHLIGLTGTDAQIAAVAKEFAVTYQRTGKPGASDYLVNHVSAPILFGPKGEPMALLTTDRTSQELAAELDKWVT